MHIALIGLLTSGVLSAEEPDSEISDLRGRTPKNVLRAHLGVTGGTGPSCPLLKDDPTVPLFLPRGDFTVDFDLNDLHIISELVCTNHHSRGDIRCEVSTNRETWVEVVAAHLIPSSRTSRVRFVGSEARYVRLKFSISEPGNLYCLGLFGLTIAADYDLKKAQAEDEPIAAAEESGRPAIREPLSEEFDQISLTITPSDTTIPWISSLESPDNVETEAFELIDENSFTICEFSPEDPSPSVLLDLEQVPIIERVGVLYAQQPGVLRMRLLQTADQRLGAPRDAGSEADEPVNEFIFEDFAGSGRYAFDSLATRSRYVELIWEPEVQSEGAPKKQAFSINEVAVFSRGDHKSVEQVPLRPLVGKRIPRTIVQSLRTTNLATDPLEPVAQSPENQAAPGATAEQQAGGDVDLDLPAASY